ncbi:hypothetical protein F7734_26805 [Scytonema sp. UIC 10036]|uniref:Pepco domain-containing protein n=1 Tax=Scytonema sp. UIC 10036 TaxID=2304196 RepID=UPI0012DA6DE9|nr:hypothetical protein [Scytonema sp. UIC 10036]MUG95770.1 hypothetical protein [Scytonema sp. UIC 10036]
MRDDNIIDLERTITIVGTTSNELRADERSVTEQTLKVTDVREGFSRFLAGLKEIISVEVPFVGEFELDEVEFTAEISANGEFKLLGTGVGIEGKSGVTFTLRRKSKKNTITD